MIVPSGPTARWRSRKLSPVPQPMSTTVSPSFRPSSDTAWFRHPDMLKPNQAKTSNSLTARSYLGARWRYASITPCLLFGLSTITFYPFQRRVGRGKQNGRSGLTGTLMPAVKLNAHFTQLRRSAAISLGARATFGLTEETGVPRFPGRLTSSMIIGPRSSFRPYHSDEDADSRRFPQIRAEISVYLRSSASYFMPPSARVAETKTIADC